jgi:16S rRNA (guanine966-N2)-methyltransferase
LFNWLQGLTLEEDCLDLYAGSGACGLEALSRGARHVTFVDASSLAASAIKSHLAALQCTQAEVLTTSAQLFLKTGPASDKQFGLVFMDPPFAAGLLATDCLALEGSGLLKADAHIYLESGDPLPEPDSVQPEGGTQPFPGNWVLRKKGKAGAVYYGLYQRADKGSGQ